MPNTATDTGMSTAFKLRLAIAFMVLVVAFGMFGFMYLEDMRPLDGLYMTIITLSTVGFQEVKPLHDASRVFVIVLIILGVVQGGFLVSLFGQLVLEGHFKEIVLRRKMEQKLKKLSDHFIIAGLGRVGRQVAQEFLRRKVSFVVIEKSAVGITKCLAEGIPFIEGDATDEDVLAKAYIKTARTLISTLPDEAQNVYLTLTARYLSPDINIIARADFDDGEKKLMRAGANHVVIPHVLGGIRMAMASLQPHVVDFMSITTLGEEGLIVEELSVPESSFLAGKSLLDSKLKQDYDVNIVGIKPQLGKLEVNPGPGTVISAGNIMVLIGHVKDLERLSKNLQTQ